MASNQGIRMHLSPRIALLAGLMALSACGGEDKELKAAKEDAENAWAHYRELSDRVDAIDSAVSDLRSQVDRFDSEDWAVVVPDVKTALDQVESDTGAARDVSGF